MKKLFLLAMLAVFQLSALKAQEPMFIGTKQSDDGIKRELYKVGAATKTKYVFENGDYFWLKDTDDFDYLQRKGQLVSEKHSWRFTYSNAVVECKGEYDECYMTFHNGDFFITTASLHGFTPPLVYLTTEGRNLEWDESQGVFVYEKGKRMTEPRSKVYGSIFDAKVKVGDDGKYEHYTRQEVEGESYIAREGDTYGFTYDYDEERNCFVTFTQTFVENYEKKYIDEELWRKSEDERHAMYGVGFGWETRKYREEIVPLNKQKEYVIAMVEAGKGGMFGLEGISYKDFTKKVKKGELDLDAVVMRYEHEIDSIEKSWIGTSIEQKLHEFYVDYNDTIVSYSFGKIGEESSTTLHYKNGDSLVLIGDRNIVSGTLTKDNGILVINSKDDVVFKFDNGDKFIPEGLDLNIWEINKSRNFILHKGLLAKADGTVEEVKDGYTESQRLAMQQAEEERQRAEDAAFRNELVAKYGEKMANAYLEGELMVGMPEELLDKFMYRYDYRYLGETNWSSDTIRYRYVRSLIFSVEEVYLYVRNGKLVDFTIYND